MIFRFELSKFRLSQVLSLGTITLLKSLSEESENPFWKRLFSPGGFEWAFRMRKGDAKSFFARQDESGELLLKRNRQLEESFESYSACTEEGENLVEEAWDLALEWEQVVSKEPR
ncbi:MAG: hypothetical protein ABF381_03245, partial [Akkermansiaceae bacterium]